MWQSHSVHQSSPSSGAIAGATKLQFNRRELDQAVAAQRTGEAIAYNELESKYSQLIVKFLIEITQECNKSVARMRHRVATHHVNFLIFYEIDQQTVKTVLRRDDYDSEWLFGQASYDA
jgi:hypothetical protein